MDQQISDDHESDRVRSGDHTVPRLHAWEADLAQFLDTAAQRGHRVRTVLDWDVDIWLDGAIPGGKVHTLPAVWLGGPLPYLDGAFDVVVIAHPHHAAEARRVATVAVVLAALPEDGDSDDLRLTWEWLADPTPVPSLSIIIPSYNTLEYVVTCLLALEATLPEGFVGEIIVVDDASTDDTASALAHFAQRNPLVKPIRNETNRGFPETCNHGAEHATGDLLYFLNADTIPQQGWLAPLLRTFDDPSIGAAGSALIFPDGRLQEAGCVVYRDGSAANIGRGIDPADPLVRFARDVDYCSGAALAIRRSLFEQLGGFDERYSPAYYEDTDLCMQVWQAGFRVRYQPDSVILHVEGSAHGTDVNAGGKRHQVTNGKKFAEKWAQELATHPVRPTPITRASWTEVLWRSRDGERRRRVLVCVPRLPDPDTESGAKRIWDLIDLLQADGWDVLLGLENAGGALAVDEALRQRGVLVIPIKDPRFVPLLEAARCELALIAFWYLADELLPVLRSVSPETRVIVDSVDVHFVRMLRGALLEAEASPLPRAVSGSVGDELLREAATYVAADGVLTVSDWERDLLGLLLDRPGLATTVPDTEDLQVTADDPAGRRGVVWVGNYNHPPNVEALQWLLAEVVPLLPAGFLLRHPLRVLGNQLALAGIETVPIGVELVGWVPDLTPEYAQARMAIAPLRHGAGTKRKVVAALASGTPMVVTPVACEGLSLFDGEQVLIADDAAAFAAAMVRLAEDDDLWRRLHERGAAQVLTGRTRSETAAALRHAIDSVLAAAPRPSIPEARPETRSHAARAEITVSPNPVRAWPERGAIRVRWSVPGDRCEVTVSVNGERETVFAGTCSGASEAAWLRVGSAYHFRLRRLDAERTVLAETTVVATADPDISDGRVHDGQAADDGASDPAAEGRGWFKRLLGR